MPAGLRLQTLFIEELGWDRHRAELPVTVQGQSYLLRLSRRNAAWWSSSGKPTLYLTRLVEKSSEKWRKSPTNTSSFSPTRPDHANLAVGQTRTGKPAACREHHYHVRQSGRPCSQKLQALAFSLEDEEQLTLFDVTSHVRAGFDVECVTRRFYDCFKQEHAAFLQFLQGLPDEECHAGTSPSCSTA